VGLNASSRVSELAIEHPSTIPVLEDLGIDYACKGNRTVGEACDAVGIDADTWLDDLDLEAGGVETDGISSRDWNQETLAALVNFIVSQHHQIDHRSLVYFTARLGRAVNSHGDAYPVIGRVEHLFRRLAESLRLHITHEEKDLFRAIELLEIQVREGGEPARHSRTLTDRILIEFLEHDLVGEKLRTMREITHDWQLPSRAPKTLKTLWADLKSFDRSLQRHMHLENNILYPRTIALEARAGLTRELTHA
jgi:regulator of cell morphogenesis and NO signaling